ncbi:tRNA (guanine-N(7)-)-methyltransferase non-catalytic subunit trm82 [Cladobotryum mycophilum]|uniref:tRNA (Guanine-N(7)-)-methyltransferase non-catalytic subunit trm82 n=1 Tax=Cladobotryum mycophilum TaxID=491253 RepID=A0ABR0SE03_9HYPO
MKIPYNRVHVQGQILFAARGGSIHTFRLSDGTHISTWKHSDVDKVASVVKANEEKIIESKKNEQIEPSPVVEEEDGPPAKRQKVAGGEGEEATPVPESTEATAAQAGQSKHFDGRGKRKGKKNKDGKEAVQDGWGRLARVPDRPVVTHMTSSEDGRHFLAVTGHDKAIWVFEHDGQGQLKQISKRIMPKRPSSVVIGPDAQIICADKFGDVYAVPLLMTESGSSTPLSALPLPTKKAFKPTANTLTVHSKGNRKALENQILQAKLDKQSGVAPKEKAEGPDFELNLLLGHVSMLTTLILGESQGRKYILTADRDEHIRASRYLPQAHIIENFCMGHTEFVNDMIIPSTKQDVLISGGGDDSLYLWDWVAGKLLSKTNILVMAQEIAPETTKVAVSGLYTLLYPSEAGQLTYILAICEDIKAIFSWHLTDDNTLNCPGITQLPGNPLHLAISSKEDKTPVLIAAIDPDKDTKAKSLHTFTLTMSDGRLTVDVESSVKDEILEVEETEISEEEVRHLLYAVESLRKVSTGFINATDEANQPLDADGDAGEMEE